MNRERIDITLDKGTISLCDRLAALKKQSRSAYIESLILEKGADRR